MTDSRDLKPSNIFEHLKNRTVLLVDVREPTEFANERIHGALLHPLSTFEPKAIPNGMDCQVIFQCGSGKRSKAALKAYMAATGKDAAHMDGGIGAWKADGLPLVVINPATGEVEDHGRY